MFSRNGSRIGFAKIKLHLPKNTPHMTWDRLYIKKFEHAKLSHALGP